MIDLKNFFSNKIDFKKVPTKQWIKMAAACLLYILFITWVGNFWWLLLLPFIADVYITKLIPWTFWKNIKNPRLRSLCSWIDAIVFALVAVYFINNFFFQNYQIPSSSLEKSLLVGDYLLVSKVHYGPRVPMTPLSMPLVQHTFPWGGQSFSTLIEWGYNRLAGIDTIKPLDIVVFNFPAGDTVATKVPTPDYYQLCQKYGRNTVHEHPETFGEITWRPVDRRENYIKRCVAIPGDTLQIINKRIYRNGQLQNDPEGVQYNYLVCTDGRAISNQQFEQLGVSVDDRILMNNWIEANNILQQLGYLPTNGKFPPVYYLPLTKDAYNKIKGFPQVVSVKDDAGLFGNNVFPTIKEEWTRDNYGPIYIPRKGVTTPLTLENLPLYERIIHVYEGHDLSVKDGVIYIDGKKANSYTFQMNYFWMMGDNRHNSEDSRYWGYVPEDHIVGKPLFIWMSIDKDKSFFESIRWERLFKSVDDL